MQTPALLSTVQIFVLEANSDFGRTLLQYQLVTTFVGINSCILSGKT